MLQRMPAFAGYATLVIGAALVAAPRLLSGPLRLEGQERAVRAIGVSDLVLVPGLLRGRPRWPWMAARAAFDLADAAFLHRVARNDAGAAVMLALTAVDGAAALALRRSAS
jgi:hypothetical protein